MKLKQRVKIKRKVHCPFCKRTISSFSTTFNEQTGKYKVEAKCICGFRIVPAMYVTKDKIDYAISTLLRKWEMVERKRKSDETDFSLTSEQKTLAIINKAKADYSREKEKEYYYNMTKKVKKG